LPNWHDGEKIIPYRTNNGEIECMVL